MRALFIWMGAAAVVIIATAGLLWWTTASAAQFRVDGDRLEVSGQLTLASTERLGRFLEEYAQLRTLVIGDVSTEGDVTALLQKGGLIRNAGLDTEVVADTVLRGDAVYLLMAGVERRLGPGAALVLTGWQTPAGPAADLPQDHPAHEERLDYVTRMLGAADLYWLSLEGAPRTLEAPEAQALGLVTPAGG